MEKSGMKINTFIATGGGTRNRSWTQLKADVLNKKIMVRDVGEAGCYGAAMLAQSAMENIPVVAIAQERSFENRRNSLQIRKMQKFTIKNSRPTNNLSCSETVLD